MALIDPELKAFLESDVAVLVGTRDAQLVGEVTPGWGPRPVDEHEVELFVDREAAKKTLENIKDNRLLAVTCTSPITYESVQLKGWCVATSDPTSADHEWVAKHRDAFGASARARGMPTYASRTMWSRDIVKLRLLVQDRFDQTPGPNAGRRV